LELMANYNGGRIMKKRKKGATKKKRIGTFKEDSLPSTGEVSVKKKLRINKNKRERERARREPNVEKKIEEIGNRGPCFTVRR